MNASNPYQAPAAPLEPQAPGGELATHMERLVAAIVDVIIVLAVTLPVMFVGGYFKMVFDAAMNGGQPPMGQQLLWGMIGIAIFYLIQGYPLSASGQTWGKRVLKIRIVDLDGHQPSFARLAGRRYLPLQLVNMIPLVGPLIGLINVLLIFRADRRCGHDHIAGTRVVKAA